MKMNRNQAGFTLLELLIVVSIMSATAYVALSTLDNDGNNRRYQETVSHLETIRQAIVGKHPASSYGQGLQSGYVVDNGKLPGIDIDNNEIRVCDANEDDFYGIDDLTHIPVGFKSYALQAARFDSSPDTITGINNSDEVELNADQQLLLKGYRNSAYLNLKPGAKCFKDGWGNDWVSSQPSINSWQILSLGLNNQIAGDELFDTDISQVIDSDSWQVEIGGWQVQVSNQTGSDISVVAGQCLRLSLLVFINSDNTLTPNQQWKRLTSSCITGNAATGSCLDGDGDGQVGANPCLAIDSVTFPITGGGVGGYQPSTKIPQGEHLLVLLGDTDPLDAHNDETESVHSSNTTQKVRFYAGTTRPDITLMVR